MHFILIHTIISSWQQFGNNHSVGQIQKEHYRQLSGQVERAREASHDFRQHIRTLQGLAEAEDLTAVREYLDRLEARTDSLQVHVHTNHPVVDAILRFYESEAVRVGADFQISLQLPPVLNFPDDELCILLGNLLENALEACQRQTDDSRFINLRANVRQSTQLLETNADGESTLPAGNQSSHIGLTSFYLNSDRYVKGTLQVKGPETYEVYGNNEKQTAPDGKVSLSLEPHRYEIVIKY